MHKTNQRGEIKSIKHLTNTTVSRVVTLISVRMLSIKAFHFASNFPHPSTRWKMRVE